jgi:hypothetical protein
MGQTPVVSFDVALTEGIDGTITAHQADCSAARMMAAMGQPVMTMLGCEGTLPADVPRHDCLEGVI